METLLKITSKPIKATEEITKAISDARAGENLIYYRGASGKCSRAILDAAVIASVGKGELCQRPTTIYNVRGYRVWDYIIQKHGGRAT